MRLLISAVIAIFALIPPAAAQAPGPVVGPATSSETVRGTTQGISGSVNPGATTPPAPTTPRPEDKPVGSGKPAADDAKTGK